MLTLLEQKFNNTIDEFEMLKDAEHVVVGVSGGADSTALLHLLCKKIKAEQLAADITVCHVNHNLRGEESDRDEAFVRELCQKLGVQLKVLSIDAKELARQAGKSVEENSRNVRYAFFEETAKELGQEKTVIATAHTLDDSLETFFINLTRGTGTNGLAGIPPMRGRIIRPVVNASRADIEEYCSSCGLDFVTDSTNLSDDYTRNKIRHNVIPALREAFPELDESFCRAERLIRWDAQYLTLQADALLKDSAEGDGYNADMLAAAHPSVLGRAVLRLLEENGAPRTEKKVEEIKTVIFGEKNAVEAVKDVYFKRKGSLICVIRKAETEPYFEWHPNAEKGEKTRLNSKFFAKVRIIDQNEYKSLKKINPHLYYNCVDYDKIDNDICLRQKKEGDKMSFHGMTKTLKKIFNEKKLELSLRSKLPCAVDDSGVFWVWSLGCDQRTAVDNNTKNICVFEIWEEE
ncbi:MAG: tRNA lysidine(34) synthetase TilS [Oscillospiraceae bacterium]|nr:tRNA lysidine(34) synthetase TilS [Oscillospiraceae bacterium]